jgi:hypothetical protein
MLLCSGDSNNVGELSAWLKRAPPQRSELQQAAERAGFPAELRALVPFPQVVDFMAATWPGPRRGAARSRLDRGAVFDSIQRLRKQSQRAGNREHAQQTVEAGPRRRGSR